MIKTSLFLFLFLIGFSSLTFAQDKNIPHWDIMPEFSRVTFKAKQMGAEFEGSARIMSGDIIFSPDALDQSAVRIDVASSSVNTQSADRDKYVHESAWLDSKNFPNVFFESTSFEKTGKDQYMARGHLTIKGLRLPQSVPFTLEIIESEMGVEANVVAEMAISRLDYGVGQGEWENTDTVANPVAITVFLRAMRTPH